MSTAQGRLVFLLVFVLLYVPFVTVQFFQMLDEQSIDLPSFYFAADVTFNQGQSPYQANAWMELQRELEQKVFPYLYPPPSLLLFAPLSWISYATAKTVMLAANHLTFLFLLYWLLFRVFRLPRPFGADDRSEPGPAIGLMPVALLAYALLYNPVIVTIYHGQINLVVTALICLFWVCLRDDRTPALTALPLAAAILLKTYPALFLLLLVVRRRFRVAAWTLGYTAAITVISLVVLPHGTWADWVNSVLPTGGYGKIPFHLFSPALPWNQSINGFTARLFLNPDHALVIDSVPARWVPTVLAVLVVGALVWVGLRLNKQGLKDHLDEEMSLVLLSLFLIAPLSWAHHLVFVLPAALLALIHLLAGRISKVAAAVIGLSVCLLAWRVAYLFEIRDEGPLSLLISMKFYATVILWVYFLNRLLRARPDDRKASPGARG